MFRQRKSVIGLDLGSSSVKAVEITQDKYDYVITACGQIDIPEEKARGEAVAELFRTGGFHTRRVAAAVGGDAVVFKFISMPDMSDEELNSAIKLEPEKYIPLAEGDEMAISTQKLTDPVDGDEAGEVKVLVVGAKRTSLDEQAQMLVEAGLQPVSISVDSFALGNAYELSDMVSPALKEAGHTIALVDIGSQRSCINILRDNVTFFAREVPMGGQDLTNAITRRFGIETFEAEALKCDPQGQVLDVQDAVAQVMGELGNEINLSFDFFENQYDGEVQEVYLSGGSALLPFLEEGLEKIFEKRTRVWNPTDGLKVRSDSVDVDVLNAASPQLAIPLGLAAMVACA